MSKLAAFAAEAAIWIAGAALIAGAAGMQWNANALLGPGPSATAWNSPSPSASPIPTLTPLPTGLPFAKATALQKNLAGMTQASGTATGTTSCGSQMQQIAGTIGFNSKGSSITLNRDGKPGNSEVVASGERYLRKGSGPWVDRGLKQTDTTLAKVLAGAPTNSDMGVQTFAGQQLHRIESVTQNLNAAEALGFDTHGWVNSSGMLRIWSTDAGAVVGFGATILWNQSISGVLDDCRMDIDIRLDAKPKVTVTAPAGAWAWVTDSGQSISYAVPSTWKSVKPTDPFLIEWVLQGTVVQMFAEYSELAGSATLDDLVRVDVEGLRSAGFTEVRQIDMSLGGEQAVMLSGVNSHFQCHVVTIHYKRGYAFAYLGPSSQTETNQATCDQLMGEIQFV